MTKSDASADLLRVAERMVWFKPPEETLADPLLFLSYAMTYGTVDDLRVVRARFSDDRLRQALRAGIPGVFDARSWAYWHAALGMHPAPPLPTRRLPAMSSSAQVSDMTSTQRSPSRRAGDRRIADRASNQVQTFFDELKNGTRNYRTVASLDAQIAQEYRGRCILELLQNAHDALANPTPDDPRRISFVLNTYPEPVLLVGNSGLPFRHEDFEGICQLAQSPKDPNESVGNKGLGFRSVLEVSGCPEIWSTTPAGSDTCFAFRFDPAALDRVVAASQDLEQRGLDARSPFHPDHPLVDWSKEHLEQYRERLANAKIDTAYEAKEFFSPYLLPLPADETPPAVRRLLNDGHATVVRLPLDGGKIGARKEALLSVKAQLDALRNARSIIFLDRLATLVVNIDDERHILRRTLDSEEEIDGHRRGRRRRLRVDTVGPEPADATVRQFHVWTRIVGGDDDPHGAESIRKVVAHLPNRWPNVRRATVEIAVEETLAPVEGVFVIFLPTEKTTGTGAHVNAPFYGSLDRRDIHFNEPYNELLLDNVLDLCLDAVRGLATEPPKGWRARAILDILSSMTATNGEQVVSAAKLREHAAKRGCPLDDQTLVLCDAGWRTPGVARLMPDLDGDDPIGIDRWREHAEFAVVSKELDCRKAAIRTLTECVDSEPDPTHPEWVSTIERMARHVRDCELGIDWNDFLLSLLTILPASLRSKPRYGPDPLADTHFLPTGDGRLIAASDAAKLFFQPVQGVDDIANLVEKVPQALQDRVAFLHPDVRSHEGQPRRNTDVQKFLDGRFLHSPRREDLIRNVVIPALPSLPVPHGSAKADHCAEVLAWTLRLLGDQPPDTLQPWLRQLPVGCHGGWFPMDHAVFGPGWPDRHGDDIRKLAAELPEDAGKRLKRTMLLPPDDERWRVVVTDRGEFFARAGVVDGLRLRTVDLFFDMDDNPRRPEPPPDTPAEPWAEWFQAVKEDVRPPFAGWFEYKLTGVQLLPELHHVAGLKPSGRHSLSRLILASLGHWKNAGWESVTVSKVHGRSWKEEDVASPLRHWLRNVAWLSDRGEQPLSQRWLVPESFLRGQSERYSHLEPLSRDLARRLDTDPGLRDQLVRLGLNVYPTEDDRTGPELLDGLASAWAAGRVPSGRFDVFLGQVRDAWRHLDPDKGLPETFLVRTGQRVFETRGRSELADVYLPDNQDRTRTLREHGMAVLDMSSAHAERIAGVLTDATDIRRASLLDERHVLDGVPWREQADGILALEVTEYQWLPVVLLSVAAYGGNNPAGAATTAWRNAADRLRGTRVLMCEDIAVELVDGDRVVGSSEPQAKWLPGDVLAVRRDVASYDDLAPAAQALLDRQDLLKDLRLVLGSLPAQGAVTPESIESALARSEIDSQALADIRHRWAGNVSLLVDRIRPVLMLFGIPGDGLDAATEDLERLTGWLSANLPQWPAPELLSAARKSGDDHAMGTAARMELGKVAELPAWNAALAKLGDRYETVENRRVSEQTKAHLEEAKALLRGLARHVAAEADDPDLFRRIEDVTDGYGGDVDWTTQWWEVPFRVVLEALRNRYAEIPGFESYLTELEGLETVADLRDGLQRRGVDVLPDPYETAACNMKRLDDTLSGVHDLHRAWAEPRTSKETRPEPPDMPAIPYAAAYLHRWSDVELLKMALEIIDDEEFTDACGECSTLDAIRQQLDLDPKAVTARREERRRREQEAARERRTFPVAGAPFEVGGGSYSELFNRLESLPVPEGPRASQDIFTPLSKVRASDGNHEGNGGRGNSSPMPPPSADCRELVGIVGEIHAYRYLRKEFGDEAVRRDAWVSEIRRKILPPVKGEPHNVSDGHGFDFEFTHRRKKWHVEVKATTGDDSQFDLGISEIEAANRLARKRGGRWRILRIRHALSVRPEFDWLPNPFEDRFKERYRLHRGGMRVSYSRR